MYVLIFAGLTPIVQEYYVTDVCGNKWDIFYLQKMHC